MTPSDIAALKALVDAIALNRKYCENGEHSAIRNEAWNDMARATINAEEALSRLLEAQAGVTCEWSPQNDYEDSHDDRLWNTGCGSEYILMADCLPTDFSYCMYCGKHTAIEDENHPPSEGDLMSETLVIYLGRWYTVPMLCHIWEGWPVERRDAEAIRLHNLIYAVPDDAKQAGPEDVVPVSALVRFRADLKQYADDAYCTGSRIAQTTPCLGWEAKVKSGEYGKAEHKAHADHQNWDGKHRGAWEALRRLDVLIAESRQPTSYPNGGGPDDGKGQPYCDPPCQQPHEHHFCPHCKPCRLAGKLGAAEDSLRALASSFGGNGYTSLEFDPKELEARVHDGFERILKVERERASAPQGWQQGAAEAIVEYFMGENLMEELPLACAQRCKDVEAILKRHSTGDR